MKIVEWNIRHGGKKEHIRDIVSSLHHHDAELIVLTEFRNINGRFIREELYEKGWVHQATSQPPEKKNGILICSKTGFSTKTSNESLFQFRSLEIFLIEHQLRIHAVHVPGKSDKPNKREFWEYLLTYSRETINDKSIIIGDFNTGLPLDAEGTPFYCVEYMEKLIELGWTDAWRSLHRDVLEYTWYSYAKNGFRLDYAFLSPSLKDHLISSYHSHFEREAGFSDHSLLFIEISDRL